MQKTKLTNWKPARLYPLTYPGECPEQSYLLLKDSVYFIYFFNISDPTSAYIVHETEGKVLVNQILSSYNLPTLNERYGIIAYGANRNPSTLAIKMKNYKYQLYNKGLAIPVLKGMLMGTDVVAGTIYEQGYVYADLLQNHKLTTNTKVDAWLTLLDTDQVRVINQSEGINKDTYILGLFPNFMLEGISNELTVIGYAGNSNIFISPEFKLPIAFKTIQAINRNLPELIQKTLLDHILDTSNLRKVIASLLKIECNDELSVSLSNFLNKQWWHQFKKDSNVDRTYFDLLSLLKNFIKDNSLSYSTASYLKKQNLALNYEESFNLDKQYMFQNILK